ncbi:MAG TPA: phage tail protein [Polyangia bacterium]|jgi:hypothetical protein|nr:phage tail protein [Polyangia bacterium]
MANDIEITVRVANQTNAGFTQVNAALNKVRSNAMQASGALRTTAQRAGQAGTAMAVLGNRADSAGNGLGALQAKARATGQGLNAMSAKAREAQRTLTELRAAAGDIRVKVALDDQTRPGVTRVKAALTDLKAQAASIDVTVKDKTGPGVASAKRALDELRTKSAEIPVSIKDKTGPGAASVTRALDRLKAKGAQITVGIKDKTQAGLARVRTAIADLKALSPVDIDVRFSGQAGEITATAKAVRDLKGDARGAGQAMGTLAAKAGLAAAALDAVKDNAQQASRSLRGLTASAAAAALALGELRDRASAAARSLRTLDNRADGAGTRLGNLGDRTRTVRSDMGDLDDVVRRLAGNLGGLRGRIGTVSTSSGRASGGMRGLLRGALLLAPALLPVAAAAVPVAGNIAAAGAAVAAFGLAIAPQIVRMAEATQAQGKYADALRKHGQGSKEAVQAENEMQAALDKMSPATREATAGFGALRDATNKWSNALSSSTMPVFTKAFATLRGMLPGFTPLVQGAASQLERFVTIAAGGVGSGAFGEMMDRFAAFSTGVLRDAVNGMVHFSRTFDGFSGGAFAEFLAYARENGPAVAETLRNLGDATAHILGSMGDLGVTTLGLVNALAKLVNAIPSEFLSAVIQAYTTFKLFGLAAAGVAAVGGALRNATRGLVAFRAAAVTAGGGIAGLRAAFLGLSAAAKTTVVVAGVTVLAVALAKLSNIGKKAPADVDKLERSLARLASTGRMTGEGARLFGSGLSGLADAVHEVTNPSVVGQVDEFLSKWTGGLWEEFDQGLKGSKESLNAWDEALANTVKGGHADLAAAAVERLMKKYREQGRDVGEVKRAFGDYREALKDQAFEQQLIADSQGLFGQAALATAEKLDAQKRSADGLRGAIQALNDVQRAGLGGMIGFEAAIDAATKAARDNGDVLRMVNGHLDVNSPKAQAAATALQDLATKTDEAAAAARQSDGDWTRAFQIYDRGRAQLIKSAQAMGLTKEQAKQLASQILKTPDKTARLKGNIEDLKDKITDAKQRLKKAPLDKQSKIKGEISDLKRKLAQALASLNNLPGNKSTTWHFKKVTENIHITSYRVVGRPGGPPSGTYYGSTAGRSADGNIYGAIKAFREGSERHVAEIAQPTMRLWAEPETGGEAYIPLSPAKRGRSVAILEDVADRFGYGLEKFARGGVTKAEREARKGLVGDLTISRFGQAAGYQRNELRSALARPSDVGALVNTLNQWRSNIAKATHGGTERRLMRALDTAGRSLLRNAKAHDKVSAELDKAKGKLADLRNSFNQLRDSVASGIKNAGNITGLAQQEGGRVSVAGIMSHLGSVRDQSKAFAGALDTLKGRGLDKNILADIASAGLEGGGLRTAEALMGASGSDIRRMNELQKQIAGNAKKAGTVTAEAMYGAGIKTAEGLVKGLEKQKKRLESVMDDVAKSFAKSLKKVLGIKGKAAGGVSGGGLTAVGERGWELLDLPAGSRVRPHGDSRRIMQAPAGGGWGGGPFVVQLHIGGRHLADVMIDPLRNAVRTRGGDVQAVLGRA